MHGGEQTPGMQLDVARQRHGAGCRIRFARALERLVIYAPLQQPQGPPELRPGMIGDVVPFLEDMPGHAERVQRRSELAPMDLRDAQEHQACGAFLADQMALRR